MINLKIKLAKNITISSLRVNSAEKHIANKKVKPELNTRNSAKQNFGNAAQTGQHGNNTNS